MLSVSRRPLRSGCKIDKDSIPAREIVSKAGVTALPSVLMARPPAESLPLAISVYTHCSRKRGVRTPNYARAPNHPQSTAATGAPDHTRARNHSRATEQTATVHRTYTRGIDDAGAPHDSRTPHDTGLPDRTWRGCYIRGPGIPIPRSDGRHGRTTRHVDIVQRGPNIEITRADGKDVICACIAGAGYRIDC